MYRANKRPFNQLMLLISLLCLTLFGCSEEASTVIVATYEGGTVTQQEFTKQFNFQRKLILPSFEETAETQRKFLEEYIVLHKIMIEKAKQDGIKIDPSELAGQVQAYKDQVIDLIYKGDQGSFEKQREHFGITDDDIKQLAEHDAYLRQYKQKIVGDIKPTDDQIKAYFDQNKGQFATGTISHILVKTEAEATQIKKRLDAGEDFVKLAQEHSVDPTAKQNGGTMTDVQFDMFVEGFRHAVATLPIGTISPPVLSDYGWHIIRVDQRIEPKFDTVKKDVTERLKQETQNEAWNAYYEKVRQEAKIEMMLPKE